MHNAHPVMQQALVAIAPASPLTKYHQALAAMNWQFEFSDDHQQWATGNNMLSRLHKLQRELDPTGEIWLSYPGAHGHGAPQPRVAEVML